MRVIHKKISYNDFISRVPGVIPSIKDTWNIPDLYVCNNNVGGEKYYDYEKAVDRAREFNLNSSNVEYSAEFVDFTKDNIKNIPNGNYGLIPSDIIIPDEIASKITDYTDIYVNFLDENGNIIDLNRKTYTDYSVGIHVPTYSKDITGPHYKGRKIFSSKDKKEIKVITYYTLNKWYNFFKDYHKTKGTYKTALEYYYNEVDSKSDDIEYMYSNLDEVYESRGGDDMFSFIRSQCIIEYPIPSTVANEWGRDSMYYPEANKWVDWFAERYKLYNEITSIDEAKDKGLNCCDYKEYIRLGGNDLYLDLQKWIDKIYSVLEDKDRKKYFTQTASLVITVNLQTSIDDLGQFSILSNEWKPGEDYTPKIMFKDTDWGEHDKIVPFGTVVDNPLMAISTGNYDSCSSCEQEKILERVLSRDTYLINAGYDGNDYDETFSEFTLSAETYTKVSEKTDYTSVRYLDYYKDNNANEFDIVATTQKYKESEDADGNTAEEVTSYTYSPITNEIIYNPKEITFPLEYNRTKCVCINGIIYEVIENGEYVELSYEKNGIANVYFTSGMKIPVTNEGYNLRFVELNDRRYFVIDEDNVSKIYFLKSEVNCYDPGLIVKKGTYVIYNSVIHLVENDFVTISDESAENAVNKYEVMDGYFTYNGKIFFIKNNEVGVINGVNYKETQNEKISTYNFNKLTNEQLEILGFKNISVSDDDVVLSYNFEIHNIPIISGYSDSKLELIRRKKVNVDDMGNELPGYFDISDKVTSGTSYYYNNPYDGCELDILYRVYDTSDLSFNSVGENGNSTITYYDGNIISAIQIYVEGHEDETTTDYCINLDRTSDAREIINSLIEKFPNDSIYCKIIYHIGAVVNFDSVNKHYILSNGKHKGVTYIDRARITKKTGKYYMSNGSFFLFKYFELSPGTKTIENSDFNGYKEDVINSYFEMKTMILNIGHENDEFSEFEKDNGLTITPIFKQEFDIGTSFPQNVEGDIYIDRGYSSSIEKHMRLLEAKTMQSLTDIGNGYFKIESQ